MANAPHANVPYRGFEHPVDEAAIATLIQQARSTGRTLRVRGALHSEHGSVLSAGRSAMHMMLDQLTRMEVDFTTKQVRAQAGISLGGDPKVPGGRRNPQFDPGFSLFEKLHVLGLALPITGGITHQTLSGFLSTGADGGSVKRSFQEAVRELTLIDGTGTKRVLARGDTDFDAALASLGLLGVLSEVVLQCDDTYDVIGMRSTQPEATCDFDLFAAPGPGRQTLVDFLRSKEYARALWWPQPGLERIELWEAARFDAAHHGPYMAAGKLPSQSASVPSPALQLLARVLLSILVEHIATGDDAHQVRLRHNPLGFVRTLYRLYRQKRNATHTKLGLEELLLVARDLTARLRGRGPADAVWYPAAGPIPEPASAYAPLSMAEHVVAAMIRMFAELSPEATAPWQDGDGFTRRYAGSLFRDPWHVGLAMDNAVDDEILPVTFTELWLPMAHAPDAMRALRDLFRAQRLRATGTFAIELYAAKQSPAWLSPTQGSDVFRVDPFWYDSGDKAERDDFFELFWETLEPFEARLHWGKALSPPDSATGVAYRTLHYPQLAAFRALRQVYDPDDVFMSTYWQRHLGL